MSAEIALLGYMLVNMVGWVFLQKMKTWGGKSNQSSPGDYMKQFISIWV